MLFQEALVMLKSGESMCRKGWTLEDGYLQLMAGMDFVWKIVIKPTTNAGNFIFSVDDLSANDWMKFKLPKTPLEGELEQPQAA